MNSIKPLPMEQLRVITEAERNGRVIVCCHNSFQKMREPQIVFRCGACELPLCLGERVFVLKFCWRCECGALNEVAK